MKAHIRQADMYLRKWGWRKSACKASGYVPAEMGMAEKRM